MESPKRCDVTVWDASSQNEQNKMERYIDDLINHGYMLHTVLPNILKGSTATYTVILVNTQI